MPNIEIGNTHKKSAAHSRESRGPPRAVKIEMMLQWGASYAWKTHPSLRARTQTQTGGAYLAKPHSAKSESAVQETAKPESAKPGNC